MSLGLYISVPFCRTKCSYCNFASDVFSKSAYENYVARLLEDIANSCQLASELGCAFGCTLEETADSIYLGGGTPSILDAAQLLRIFAAVRRQFAIAPNAEITVECAPGTLTPAVIETLLQCGVNRVSLGVQSFVDREAQSVGRLHKRTTVLEEIGRLREAGLANINVDLIAGLPHQTAESWAFSVSETIATGVPHVSIYMLEVDEDSRLGRELIAGGARYHAHFVPDDDATADFYQQACQMLASAGIAQYEISNFARTALQLQNNEPHKNESRHNLKYWTRQPYLGFGVDAHSMLAADRNRAARHEEDRHRAVRCATPDSLDAYMNRAPHTVTPVSAQAAIEEAFFLGLRLNRGIDLDRLRTEFSAEFGPANFLNMNCHPDPELVEGEGPAVCRKSERTAGSSSPSVSAFSQGAVAVWESAIDQCVHEGLLEQQGATVRLTGRGRLLSNEVFARFLTEETKVGTGHVNPR
ncbi:MAG TPA: radical SAM family heme chaperone HemW [Terriglobales bacterium]|jgi:oxygen-independent coproporphyrinogen-3 oxidase